MPNQEVTVIGFDLGTSCGVAVVRQSGKRACWSDQLSKPKDSGVVERYVRFRDGLRHLLKSIRGKKVVGYEVVHAHSSAHSAHLYGAFQGLLLTECADADVQVVPVTVQQVKRRATGFHNAPKDDVMSAVRAAGWTFTVGDDDAADAAMVAQVVEDYLTQSS